LLLFQFRSALFSDTAFTAPANRAVDRLAFFPLVIRRDYSIDMRLERMPTFPTKGIYFRLLTVFVFHGFSFPGMGLHPPAAGRSTIIHAATEL
jgi:hypothetical protein